MKKAYIIALTLILILAGGSAGASTILDVYDWDVDQINPVGQIQTIATAQTGAQHYSYSSSSGHPSNVNLSYYSSSFWVHENTSTGEFTFGFIFGIDGGPYDPNYAYLYFRIVNSDTDVYVSQSDDPGEATELSAGWFQGDYYYYQNTDGIAVSGLTGTDWTIMVDSVDFGNVTSWYAASGETSDYSDDLSLTLGHEYRIVFSGDNPSQDPVNPNPVPIPASFPILGFGLAALAGLKKRKF